MYIVDIFGITLIPLFSYASNINFLSDYLLYDYKLISIFVMISRLVSLSSFYNSISWLLYISKFAYTYSI